MKTNERPLATQRAMKLGLVMTLGFLSHVALAADIKTLRTCRGEDTTVLHQMTPSGERILVLNTDGPTAYNSCVKDENRSAVKFTCEGSESAADIVFMMSKSDKTGLLQEKRFFMRETDLLCD